MGLSNPHVCLSKVFTSGISDVVLYTTFPSIVDQLADQLSVCLLCIPGCLHASLYPNLFSFIRFLHTPAPETSSCLLTHHSSQLAQTEVFSLPIPSVLTAKSEFQDKSSKLDKLI